MATTPAIHQIEGVSDWLIHFQQNSCEQFQLLDETLAFETDSWTYPAGGGGRSRCSKKAQVFERIGVNFSHIRGPELPAAATAKRQHLANLPFQAMGVSIVAHPESPMIPTAHANIRLFCTEPNNDTGTRHWWFGGGFDLTPTYAYTQDCKYWHESAKRVCDTLSPTAYETYKAWCDRYFTLPHRQEQRGIGGIFFDDLTEPGFEKCFEFIQNVGTAFLSTYGYIVSKRKNTPYTDHQKAFQLYRRGRYVEFNLLYDRGTLFGLQSGGRTESILMSMPPLASWEYNLQPPPESPESQLTEYYLQPRDWLNETTPNQEINDE